MTRSPVAVTVCFPQSKEAATGTGTASGSGQALAYPVNIELSRFYLANSVTRVTVPAYYKYLRSIQLRVPESSPQTLWRRYFYTHLPHLFLYNIFVGRSLQVDSHA